jgi:GNAT superfamily N-acetyltransferase
MSMLSDLFELGPAHLGACQQLSIEAGWNQNHNDWAFILEHGIVLGVTRGDRLVASAGVVPYGRRFGWICMVLVTAPERRNGLASRLMKACMDWCAARGVIAGLDATPAGREVYRRLGFHDVYPVTRLQRMELSSGGLDSADTPVRPLAEADAAALIALDRDAFGEDRKALLLAWQRRMPHAALVMPGAAGPAGYVLAREGRVATQIGPLVARDAAAAEALLRDCLSKLDGPVFIDVPDRHAGLTECLASLGFSKQRAFTRMLLGRSEPLDRPEYVFALTGPEFG